MGFGFALCYMGFLFFGAIIVPGVGISGHLMVQMPSTVLEWSHAPGYGLLAWLLTTGLQGRGWPFAHALAVSSTAALVFGLWTEVFQGSVPGRHASIGDLVTDAVGISLVAMLMIARRMLDTVPLSSCFRRS